MFTFLYLLKRVTAFFHRNISDFASSFFQFYACAKLVPAAGYSKNVQQAGLYGFSFKSQNKRKITLGSLSCFLQP